METQMSRALRRASQVLGSPTGINCAKEDDEREDDEETKQQQQPQQQHKRPQEKSQERVTTNGTPSNDDHRQVPRQLSSSSTAEQKSLKATGSNGKDSKGRGGGRKDEHHEIACHGTQDVAIETNSLLTFGGPSGSQLLNSLPLFECTQGANSTEEGQLTVKDTQESTYQEGDKGKDPVKIVKKQGDNQVPLLACHSVSDKEEEEEKGVNKSIRILGQEKNCPKIIPEQSASLYLTTSTGDEDATLPLLNHSKMSQDLKQRRHMTFDTKSTGDADEEKFREEFREENVQVGEKEEEDQTRGQKGKEEDADARRKKTGGAEEEENSKDAQVKQVTNEANSSWTEIPSKKFVDKDKDTNENQGQVISKEDEEKKKKKKEEEEEEKEKGAKSAPVVEEKCSSEFNVATAQLNFNDPVVTKVPVDAKGKDKHKSKTKFGIKFQEEKQLESHHFDLRSQGPNGKGSSGYEEEDANTFQDEKFDESTLNQEASSINSPSDQSELEDQSNENELIELLNEHRNQLRFARATGGGNEGDVYFRFFTQLLRCLITVGFIYYFKQKSKELFLPPPH